ncbi:hypothetical protein RHSIM_Rhsim05G0195500 [Rhododendron simsii]|uniref:non-specific serine/threonine protein kinase n=1 Tax=Rhododendron simsii TaxID=118357 RepID=A0A834LR43_RHOSS|nr:hypothetical protein RHSIM_Rhsim05G0195500 [Rhododendron simsii]
MTNLLSLLCFLSLLSNPSSSQPTEFTYTAFNQIGTNITLSGSSQILKNGILKLTNDTRRLMGHAFYTSPLKFKNSPDGSVFSFSTCFAIAIVPEYKKLGGHGLAFALSSTRDLRSALPSQYLGLLNNSDVGNFSNHLFAVEFDTVQDFEFRDINGNIVSCLFVFSPTPKPQPKSIQMINLLILLCFSSLLSIPSSSQPTEFTYAGFRQIGPNITLSGSSQILKNGILKLTNDSSKLMGHAFYASPLRFKSSPNGSVFSFSTCFAFVIVPEYQTLGGHGLAFALSPSIDLSSALPSHYLGLFNDSDVGNSSNHLFAVEFDTVQNVEVGDINENHIGIDINSLKSNESAVAAYYTTDMKRQELNLKGGKPILVWIDYDSVSTQINVTISPSNLKPRLPIISYKYDLSTLLHESTYVGFSASTGLLASSHYILGWSFKMNGIAESLSFNSLPSLPGPEKRQTTLIIGVSVSSSLFLIAAILGGVYLLWKIKNRDVIEDWELELGPHR